jgi:hypothetical protein
MHPEILRQIIDQRGREARAQAEEGRVARQVLRTLRAQRRNGSAHRDGYAIPAIPDYVDGSFADSAAGQANSAAGHVPAARNAA